MPFTRRNVENESSLVNSIIVSKWDNGKRWREIWHLSGDNLNLFIPSFYTQDPVALGPLHWMLLQMLSWSGRSILVGTTRLGRFTTEPQSTSTSKGCFCLSITRELGAPMTLWMNWDFWEALALERMATVWPQSQTGQFGTYMIGDLLTLLCPASKEPARRPIWPQHNPCT